MPPRGVFVTEMSITDSPPPAAVRPRRRWLRVAVGIVLLVLLALGVRFLLHLLLPRNFQASGAPIAIQVAGRPLDVLYYCGDASARGVVVLGTGSGGWSYWEERVAKHLVGRGYAVAGWDCRKLADSRTYTHEDLVDGFADAANVVAERAGAAGKSIWYGGWSTGAEQATAAAADARPLGQRRRPRRLVGLLLAAPGTRGRYGIETSDLLGITPTGENTFALADIVNELRPVAIAQFAAGLDPMDDRGWLDSYVGDHKIFEVPGVLHDMGGAGDAFLAKVDEAMEWSLQ